MGTLILVIVVCGAILAIASGIWVAYALGTAISFDRKKNLSSEASEDLEEKKLYS